jgi:hypothetical protein
VKLTALVVGIVLLAAAGVAVSMLHRSPSERACDGLRRVCGEDVAGSECERELDDATASEVEDVLACVEPADTCVEAVACLGGAALRDAGEGFFRGVTQTR